MRWLPLSFVVRGETTGRKRVRGVICFSLFRIGSDCGNKQCLRFPKFWMSTNDSVRAQAGVPSQRPQYRRNEVCGIDPGTLEGNTCVIGITRPPTKVNLPCVRGRGTVVTEGGWRLGQVPLVGGNGGRGTASTSREYSPSARAAVEVCAYGCVLRTSAPRSVVWHATNRVAIGQWANSTRFPTSPNETVPPNGVRKVNRWA